MLQAEHDIIDLIYEAALRPDLWPQVLASVSSRLDLFGGVLIIDTPKAIRWSADDRMRPVMQAFVEGGWHRRNTRMAGRIRCGKRGFVDEFDMYSRAQLLSEPMYVRHFRPHKLGWSASALIEGPHRENIVVDFEQLADSGPVGDAVKGFLDRLRPHFARALLLSTRLAEQAQSDVVQSLQLLDLPAFVVDEAGKVVAANPATERLGRIASVVAGDRLSIADSAAQVKMLEALEKREYAYCVPRSILAVSGQDAYVMQIVPLARSGRDLFARSASLVYFNRVGGESAPQARVLRALFDLTPREAEVAEGVLRGMSAKVVAARDAVSVETVRKQIKSILAKAGVKRQVELSNLLSSLVLPHARELRAR